MTYFRGASAVGRAKVTVASTELEGIDRKVALRGELLVCASCGDCWKTEMLDECVACGLGAGIPGICPKCMQEHRCCEEGQ